MRRSAYDNYQAQEALSSPTTTIGVSHAFAKDVLVTARNLQVAPSLHNLYAHLMENHYIDCINGFNPDILDIFSRDVLQRIKSNDESWATMVPEPVVAAIKTSGLFGYSK